MITEKEIERFSYYMTFFEHSLSMQDKKIIARRLKAPDFEDFKNIKSRLASVLLKTLRSKEVLNLPRSFKSENLKIVVASISRWKKIEFELQRYMRFILQLDVEFHLRDNVLSSSPPKVLSSENPQDKLLLERFYDAIVHTSKTYVYRSATGRYEEDPNVINLPSRQILIDHLIDNYVVSFHINDSNSSVSERKRLFQGITPCFNSNLPESISVSEGTTMMYPIQQYIFDNISSISGYALRRINLSRMCRDQLFGDLDSVYPDNSNARKVFSDSQNWYGETFVIPKAIYNSSTAIKNLPDNIYIPLNGHRCPDGLEEVSFNIVISKKSLSNSGEITINPSKVQLKKRYSIMYDRESLMDPESFHEINEILNTEINLTLSRLVGTVTQNE